MCELFKVEANLFVDFFLRSPLKQPCWFITISGVISISMVGTQNAHSLTNDFERSESKSLPCVVGCCYLLLMCLLERY
jgi:hypothetical protein